MFSLKKIFNFAFLLLNYIFLFIACCALVFILFDLLSIPVSFHLADEYISIFLPTVLIFISYLLLVGRIVKKQRNVVMSEPMKKLANKCLNDIKPKNFSKKIMFKGCKNEKFKYVASGNNVYIFEEKEFDKLSCNEIGKYSFVIRHEIAHCLYEDAKFPGIFFKGLFLGLFFQFGYYLVAPTVSLYSSFFALMIPFIVFSLCSKFAEKRADKAAIVDSKESALGAVTFFSQYGNQLEKGSFSGRQYSWLKRLRSVQLTHPSINSRKKYAIEMAKKLGATDMEIENVLA